jgi:hypothetical protein
MNFFITSASYSIYNFTAFFVCSCCFLIIYWLFIIFTASSPFPQIIIKSDEKLSLFIYAARALRKKERDFLSLLLFSSRQRANEKSANDDKRFSLLLLRFRRLSVNYYVFKDFSPFYLSLSCLPFLTVLIT